MPGGRLSGLRRARVTLGAALDGVDHAVPKGSPQNRIVDHAARPLDRLLSAGELLHLDDPEEGVEHRLCHELPLSLALRAGDASSLPAAEGRRTGPGITEDPHDHRRAAARITGRPPRGLSVGICLTLSSYPGGSSGANRCSKSVETTFTTVCPSRFPIQIREPPPKGT